MHNINGLKAKCTHFRIATPEGGAPHSLGTPVLHKYECIKKSRLGLFIGGGVAAAVAAATGFAIDNGRRAACVTFI